MALVLSTGRPGLAPMRYTRSKRQNARVTRRYALLGLLAAGGVILTGTGAYLTFSHWAMRYGSGYGWTNSEWAYFAAGWASVLGAQLSGLWLWWKAPGNLTGRWLWLAGVALGLWFVGSYWPRRWAELLTLTVYFFRPALAFALLGWPTGRPTRRVRNWIVAWTVTAVVSNVGTGLFTGSMNSVYWPANPLAPFDVPWVNDTVGAGFRFALYFIVPVVAIVVFVRRRRRLPRGARRLLTPITVAGVSVAGSDLLDSIV